MKTTLSYEFDDRRNEGTAEDMLYPYLKGRDMLLALYRIHEELFRLYDGEPELQGLDPDTIEHILGVINDTLDNLDIDINRQE